ncbi:LacI family DNA-binding transcriptional regulator [Hoeflea sp.]|uniref:LacI family DNA-binding transcriptional regulator n=1 Tax=Hoeflea sp. TaxID=1940281 RepID=UPI003A9074D0
MSDQKARIIDIALHAGVSTATVDRVLNERPGVREKTVRKVLEAAEWLSRSGGRPQVLAPELTGLTLDVMLGGQPGFAKDMLISALRGTARELGVTLRMRYAQKAKVPELSSALNEALAEGTNGVIMEPIEHPLIRDKVNELAAHGIPVVSILTPLPDADVVFYSGMDNRAAGRTAGALMGHISGRKGKAAIFMSDTLYRSHEERESGVRTILRQDFPDITVLDVITMGDNPSAFYGRALDLLDRHPDLTSICNLGAGNRGIERALLEKGRSQDMAYIAFNLTPLTRNALLDGTVDAVIHQDMVKISDMAMRAVGNFHAGLPIEARRAPSEIIMRENVHDIRGSKEMAVAGRE